MPLQSYEIGSMYKTHIKYNEIVSYLPLQREMIFTVHYISFTASTAGEEGDDDHPSSLWLAAIARGTMDTYSTNILKIRSITQHASRQLATDIG